MMLASLKDGHAGRLLVVSRDLTRCADPHAVTPVLKFGDKVRIEMRDAQGKSIFGAIEQDVVRYTRT